MLYPIEVNMEVIDERGNTNIVAIVFDFHPSRINELAHTLDGNTSVLSNGHYYKLLVPYQDMKTLYNRLHPINNEFKEDVDAYFKDKYKAIKQYKAKQNYERGETD